MITGDYHQLKDLAANNVCAADGGMLEVAWDDKQSVHFLLCGTCGATRGIKGVNSPTQDYKQGQPLPAHIEDNVKKGMEKRGTKKPVPPGAVTMGGVPATDLGTGELLVPEVVKAMVEYAQRYGLDPARGHVCLMYGKPYFTIDAYLYHANRSGIAYDMASQPLSTQDRTSYQIAEGDHAWITRITLVETGATLTGLGIVTKEEMEAKSKHNPQQLAAPVVARHPWQLAQKRSEWQALRRAFPIGESEDSHDDD